MSANPRGMKRSSASLAQTAQQQAATGTAARRQPRRSSRQAGPVPSPRAPRRVRQTIKKIDLWSALKISLCFYLCEMAVAVTAIASLWVMAEAFGVVGNVEDFIGDLLSTNDFTFTSPEMLRGAILVALVLVVLQIVVTVVACAFYNLFSQLFGGIEITVIQEEAPSHR
jgi:hypothetical protein